MTKEAKVPEKIEPTASDPATETLRAVVYQEKDLWIVHGLEYSIVGVSQERANVYKDFCDQVDHQIAIDREAGHEPFHGFRPAPERFWDLYDKLRETDRAFNVTFSAAGIYKTEQETQP